ncbi:MAG: protein kinase [Myxococcales bacterium]|nr:protein kinase [Myxococcales bacterium]
MAGQDDDRPGDADVTTRAVGARGSWPSVDPAAHEPGAREFEREPAALADTVALAPDPSREDEREDPASSSLASPTAQTMSVSGPDPYGATSEMSTIGGYVIERQLGAGGMGEVYAARHAESGERVALKTLSRARADLLYRFKREFRVLADVERPNLVRLHELGVSARGEAYFTMELLTGVPFVAWVRDGVDDGALPDRARLEGALRQLVLGVEALHALGCVHRDLKPSNVLVDHDGRVVILDFGLISELDEPEHVITKQGQILGTPAYMAPEQARGGHAGPAADYYAIGVMLFECLTGERPHAGTLYHLLAAKQQTLDTSQALLQAPPRLRALCAALLDREPARRPSAATILDRLDPDGSRSGQPQPATIPRADLFVGRVDELTALHDAYRYCCEQRRPIVVHVRGLSGQGKSTLLRRLRRQLNDGDEPVVLLHGRCREQETLPYKGVDAVIDSLSAHLRRLPGDELAALRPEGVSALVRVFPVLDDLWPRAGALRLQPRELLGVVRSALRQVINGLAERAPLIIQIDDFQWTDVESLEFLQELVRPPSASRILLTLVLRGETGAPETLRMIEESELLGVGARRIELEPLPYADALTLAKALTPGRSPADRELRAESVALRSGGNPFYIGQLARGVEDTLDSGVELDAVVARRLADLDAPARGLLELVAVAGGPLSAGVAAAICPGVPTDELESMVERGLLVIGESASEDAAQLEAAHDRIREVALRELAPARRVELHAALGDHLLARCDGEPEGELVFRVVEHLHAGYPELAQLPRDRRLELAQLELRAGERALAKASFELARVHFERAHAANDPWREHGPRGGAHHQRCVAIQFGWARTVRDFDEADRLFEALLTWPLDVAAFGEVVYEQMLSLAASDRFDAMFELGLDALRRLGVKAPRTVTWPAVLWQLTRADRALRRPEVQDLARLPEVVDVKTNATLRILAWLAGWTGLMNDPRWGLWCTGQHAQLVAQHGRHDTFAMGLTSMLVFLTSGRSSERARSLWERLRACERAGILSATDRARTRSFSTSIVSRLQPLHEAAAPMREYHDFCLLVQKFYEAAYMNAMGGTLMLDAGTPAPEVIAFIDACLPVTREIVTMKEFERFAEATRQVCMVLIEGPEHEIPASPEIFYMLMGLRRAWLKVLRRAYLEAWADLTPVVKEYDQIGDVTWTTPIYSALTIIVSLERIPDASRLERARLHLGIRKYRAKIVRWAADCPANWEPLLALVDAELRAGKGRLDDAMILYERARQGAAENRMSWLAGLAADRLAIQAERRGLTLVVEAALRNARGHYERWGAADLVRRVDVELARVKGRPGA